MKRAIIVLLIIAAIGAGAGAYYIRRGGAEPTVNTAPVTRGEIVDTVGSTGALQAVTTVQVGSQVSGNIAWLGADFNSIVRKGQVIARVDPSLFEAQVQQAKANLLKSQADVERNKVALVDAQQKYTRAKELAAKGIVPQSELDAATIGVDSAQAMVRSSQATVEQARATLSQNEVNLEHCVITAPIDGIVTQRSVDVGQTVAASLQSPTLFVIAADLTKMQVNANIDEADVGRIRPGQTVTFRVDAYPTEEFQGTVSQIRLQPVVVQNVTTYGTIIDVPNTELKLKPGMTANLKVQIATRSDVLRVPNAALRFRPTSDMFAALGQAVPSEVQLAGGRGGRGQGRGTAAAAPPTADAGGRQAADRPNAGPAGRRQDGGGDRRAAMMDRFKNLSPDERKQFIDRMKARGADVSAFEAAAKAEAGSKPAGPSRPPSASLQFKYGGPQSAQTIDALFAPLPSTETQGRAWLFVDKQLKPVRLRLGISDGTNTELLSGELQPGMELVTGIVMGTRATNISGSGNPLMPGPPRGPGGFGPRGR